MIKLKNIVKEIEDETSPENNEVITKEEFHHYGNFVLNALMGRNPDEYYTQYSKNIDKVSDILRKRFGPTTGTTVYRGIILDPKEVNNGVIKNLPHIRYASFSEDIDVAIAFADPQNPMASFLTKLYPNKRGYIITEKYDPRKLLYHHSWSKIFPMERIFGADVKSLEKQKEVILKPEPEYKVVPIASGSSKGYWVGEHTIIKESLTSWKFPTDTPEEVTCI